MQRLAKMIDGELPQGWGFGLMLFPFGEEGVLLWTSNARREEMVATMREFIEKQGGKT